MMRGAPSIRRRITTWISAPNAAQPSGTAATATQNGNLKPTAIETVESAAIAMMSPCAKLITRITPKIKLRPQAISA